jgi:hypothetical protein
MDGCGISNPPPAFETRTVHPVVSHYIRYAIPAQYSRTHTGKLVLYLRKHHFQIDACGNECILTHVLNFVTTFKWVFSIKLRPIYLYGNYPALVAPRVGQEKRKNLLHLQWFVFNDSAVFPEPTHYADWAVTLKIHMTSNVLCEDSVSCQGYVTVENEWFNGCVLMCKSLSFTI